MSQYDWGHFQLYGSDQSVIASISAIERRSQDNLPEGITIRQDRIHLTMDARMLSYPLMIPAELMSFCLWTVRGHGYVSMGLGCWRMTKVSGWSDLSRRMRVRRDQRAMS